MRNLFTNLDYPVTVNDWFITDDASLQYCRKDPSDKKEGCYEFIQYVYYPDETYAIIYDTVDIYDYIGVEDDLAYEELIMFLSNYGYGMSIVRGDMDDKQWSKVLLKEFKKQNGEEWKRMFAECVFETLIFQGGEAVESGLNVIQMEEALTEFLLNN